MNVLKNLKAMAIGALFIASAAMVSCNGSESAENNSDSTAMDTSMNMNSGAMDNPAPMVSHAEAVLSGTSADTTLEGKATFDTIDGKVKMVLNITVPKKANQSVAVHLHEHGDCGDMGKDAHGHWNPTNQNHGKWGSSSFHLGDIGNVALDAKGKGMLEMETNLWTLGGDSTSNIIGRAVIVHGGVDDFTTQPTGNAGSRIGCGVIQ